MSAPASPTGSTHAHHHVVDQRGIELVAALDGAERLARQIERGHLVQRAVHLAAAARRAHVIVDEGVGHEFLSVPSSFPRKREIHNLSPHQIHRPGYGPRCRGGDADIVILHG